jgi:hypothetical protein
MSKMELVKGFLGALIALPIIYVCMVVLLAMQP